MCFASKKSSEREFFVPAGTHLDVKLLNLLFLFSFFFFFFCMVVLLNGVVK